MNTKITIAAAIVLASVSGAFASEAFDVDINRPVVTQTQGYESYAQAPSARQVQAERRQSVHTRANTSSDDKAYTGHGSQID
jgi:hypothetical protein